MRKFSLLLIALLVVSTGAFAQVTIEPEIEIEASATWGVNLDEETHGLENKVSVDLSFVFREESTEEFGQGHVYGWIELEDFSIEMDYEFTSDDTDSNVIETDAAGENFDQRPLVISIGDINARLYLAGPMVYIDILDAPGGIDEAKDLTLIEHNILPFSNMAMTDDLYTGKVALGIALPDLLEIEFGVRANHWDSNPNNDYMLSIDAEIVAVPDLSIALTASMLLNDDDAGTDAGKAGVGVGVEYTMPLTADIDLIPALGFDYVVEGDDDYWMEFGAALNFSWAGLGTDDDEEELFGVDADLTSGFTLGVLYGQSEVGGADNSWLSFKAGLFEDSGDDGLLPVIGAGLLFQYNQNLETDIADLAFGLEVNADLGVVEPFAGLTYVTTDVTDETAVGAVSYMYLNVGTDINVIDNTTFTIAYESGELLQDDNAVVDTATLYGTGDYLGSARESGQLWIRTKISF